MSKYFIPLTAVLCSLFLMSGFAYAQTEDVPPKFETCIAPETSATRNSAFAACTSVIKYARRRYTELQHAEKAREKQTGQQVSDARFNQRLEAQKPYQFFMGMGYGRIAQMAQALRPETHALVCWANGKAVYWLPGTYETSVEAYAPLLSSQRTLRKKCAQHPRTQSRDWSDIPDTGNLATDIPSLTECLGPINDSNFYERFYDCERSDNEINGLIVKAHSYQDRLKYAIQSDQPAPKTPLKALYVARAKVTARQSQLMSKSEPDNFADICKQVYSGVYYLQQAGVTAQTKGELMPLYQGLNANKTKCQAMGF